MAVAQLQSMRRCYFFGHSEEQTILLIMTCGTRDPAVRLNMTIFFLMASMKDGFNIFLESFFVILLNSPRLKFTNCFNSPIVSMISKPRKQSIWSVQVCPISECTEIC